MTMFPPFAYVVIWLPFSLLPWYNLSVGSTGILYFKSSFLRAAYEKGSPVLAGYPMRGQNDRPTNLKI